MNSAPYTPGLEGVVAGQSAISCIDVELNRLIIRGYDLVELTEKATFEEVAYLLLHDDLPDTLQYEAFRKRLGAARALPEEVIQLLRHVPRDVHPMALLRTAVSLLAHHDSESEENSHDANVRKAERLLAQIPGVIAAAYRIREGQELLEPRNDLDQASHFLYLLRGSEPLPFEVAAMNTSLIVYAEHGYNASTFAARVTASTLSSLHASVTSAIATLAGPLHGGANEKAMEMLLQVGSVDRAEQWVAEALAAKKKIMGFGHREYKSGDSRVPAMKRVARQVAEQTGAKNWLQIGEVIEATMKREKGIFPNVDFPCAYTYFMMNIPIGLYTPIFVSSRITGWAAHVIEQHDHNRLIRPNHIYTGPIHRSFEPLSDRVRQSDQ